MLYEAYLSHPKLHHIAFDDALKNRALYICLKNLALIAQRKRAARGETPPLELT